MLNALTIDVEDWYHTFSPLAEGEEDRIIYSVEKTLNLLKEYGVSATFFILGIIAEKHPEVVWRIRDHGHEVGLHSYTHQLIYQQGRAEFARLLEKALCIFKGITSEEIKVFRAPCWSITEESLWALDVLLEHGLECDSSIYPVKLKLYGIPSSPRHPYQVREGLWEFPPSTLSIWKRNVPVAGGASLRLFPYWITRQGIRAINRKGWPALVYLHTWELDTALPRVELSLVKKTLQYGRLKTAENKLKRLLEDFSFTGLSDCLQNYRVNI